MALPGALQPAHIYMACSCASDPDIHNLESHDCNSTLQIVIARPTKIKAARQLHRENNLLDHSSDRSDLHNCLHSKQCKIRSIRRWNEQSRDDHYLLFFRHVCHIIFIYLLPVHS